MLSGANQKLKSKNQKVKRSKIKSNEIKIKLTSPLTPFPTASFQTLLHSLSTQSLLALSHPLGFSWAVPLPATTCHIWTGQILPHSLPCSTVLGSVEGTGWVKGIRLRKASEDCESKSETSGAFRVGKRRTERRVEPVRWIPSKGLVRFRWSVEEWPCGFCLQNLLQRRIVLAACVGSGKERAI